MPLSKLWRPRSPAPSCAFAGPVIAEDEEKEAEAPASLSPEEAKAFQLYRSIKWQKGPCIAEMGSTAEIKLTEGYQFTGPEGTADLPRSSTRTPASENILGVLTPVGSLDWFIVFQYDEMGYVRDDEKDKIDADAILASIREGTEEANKLRRSKGWGEVQGIVWEHTPAYDPASHNLVWATAFNVGDHRTVNYSTRILGRRGVVNANLVTEPELIKTVMPSVKGLIAGLEYKSGLRYAEFESGDKVAAYGLTALITGGAAAVALKTGLLAKLGVLLAKGGKVIVLGIAAVGGGIAKVFGGRKQTN